MKTHLLISFLFLVLGISCRSVDKMVDEGRYDEALEFAARKIRGKDYGKTKYVKALEEAFEKLNRRDIRSIESMKLKGDPGDWDKIYDLSVRISNRQNMMEALMPVVSKDGYTAHFEFVETGPMIAEAAKEASQYHYSQGIKAYEQAIEKNDRYQARIAFASFDRTKKYYRNFEDSESYLEKAHSLGTTHVLIKWNVDIPYKVTSEVYNLLEESPVDHLNSFWLKFHGPEDIFDEIDFLINLQIKDIDISPEREWRDRFTEKKVVEKSVTKRDSLGKAERDSLGNVIKIIIQEEKSADVVKVSRRKSARLIGFIELKDFVTGKIMDSATREVVIEFLDESASYRGDREALSPEIRRLADHRLIYFPDDYTMLYDGLRKLQSEFELDIRQFNY